VKIEVVRGQVYYGNKRAASPGDVIDLPDAEAKRLITLGVAKAPGSSKAADNSDPAPPKTPEEIAAEVEAAAKKAAEAEAKKAAEAAKKRKKAEESAVKKGLGTAEEIAALSDEDLQSLFKAKK
jgi:4-hydroxyphenylpyruvate dioxygenase-like putative hemolysin